MELQNQTLKHLVEESCFRLQKLERNWIQVSNKLNILSVAFGKFQDQGSEKLEVILSQS